MPWYSKNGYKESITDDLITRDIEKGFNDPRHWPLTITKVVQRTKSDTGIQEEVGVYYCNGYCTKVSKELKINYDNTGSTIEELELTEDMFYYPLYTDDSDYSAYARGSVLDHKIKGDILHPQTQQILSDFVDVDSAPVYPYNKVHQSESGHVFEVDDTLGKERINVHHRSGTFHEIHADAEVTRM